MKELIGEVITRSIVDHKANWSESLADRYFDEPLVNFAAGDDPIFEEFKQIIGPWHRTPREAYEALHGEGSWHGGTVVSWVMPWSKALRDSNRRCTDRPSVEWTKAYDLCAKVLQKEVRRELLQEMERHGVHGVAPTDAEWFRIMDAPDGKTSPWSDRHVAFAAGLGTFGLNNAFLSTKGMAIVLNSVVIDAVLDPDQRTAEHHRADCLHFKTGACGACIRRCPAQAVSTAGHDKIRCMIFGYGPDSVRLAKERGVEGPAGCALCQVGVPCEACIPGNRHRAT
ncbi:epoxyqueuosine reductase [Geomonas nitrogeniifigens]|uniref:epoxyqueuosine reductase n=1 Tax=Geomonas diazotrophica TaxID=2843197 RepID=UPI001C2BE2E5|nr:epoxyqueuosine reductase [Geomonas nitrogeniifigens]QXE87419.1 epoxyqueuosine reductase [Geomonas nitrogeniifigens]